LRIAVLGVGLIGGSIGLAARRRSGAQVAGYDRDSEVCERALRIGAIDVAFADPRPALAAAEVVFVATPVGTLRETVGQALAEARPDCVVTDVGSTKRLLVSAGADPRFIGGHPLAGAESAGVENAREDLFEDAVWYLTPAGGNTTGVLYERLHRLLSSFGARPVAIDPDTHDRLMACVSHLPHVLANALVLQAAGELVAEDSERLPAVGPSFRDATRVAGANSAIWTDIYRANGDALVRQLDLLLEHLGEVRSLLAAGSPEAIGRWNERARGARESLLGAALAGGPVQELRVSVPNRPGVIAEIALALGREGVNISDMALAPSEDNRQGVVALWIAGERPAERALELVKGLGFPVARVSA